MKTTPRAALCGIEPLESRIAPAGIVTADYNAATGALTLTGDGMDNSISIFQTGANTYRIEDEAGSINILGTHVLDIGRLTSVTFDGGGGADGLGLVNVRTLTALTFTGGSGDDSIFARDSTVKGDVVISGGAGATTVRFTGLSTVITGSVRIEAESAATDRVEVDFAAQKTVVAGSLRVSGGGGMDVLQATATGPVSIGKGVSFNSGDGGGEIAFLNRDLIKIGKLPTGESIVFTGGGGADTLTLEGNAMLSGGIAVTGGALGDSISLGSGPETMKIGKLAGGQSILFDAAADGDTLSTNAASLTLAGGIEFSAGDGTNLIDLVSSGGILKIGKLAGGQSILFNGGTGSDDITSDIGKVTMAGGIELNGEGGNNDIEFDDNGVVKIGKFGAGRSVFFTGTANASNEVVLGGFVTVSGSVEVIGGTGSDRIQLGGKASVGKSAAGVSVLLNGGSGDDEIEFRNSVSLAGMLKLDGGDNDDRMRLGGIAFNVDRLNVKGAVEFDGGAGDDTFEMLAQSAILGSTLTVTGGNEADSVTISANGFVMGNVSLDLGGAAAGSQAVSLGSGSGTALGLVFKGSLFVDATAATDDSLSIENVSVAGLIDLRLGDGVSTVTLDNFKAGDEFRLDTRGGADVVNMERNDRFGGSVIKKLASIQLGDGDDQLAIGRPTPAVVPPFPDSTRVNFIGGLVTDGGGHVAGDDRNDFGMENDFGVPLTPPANFEAMTII